MDWGEGQRFIVVKWAIGWGLSNSLRWETGKQIAFQSTRLRTKSPFGIAET